MSLLFSVDAYLTFTLIYTLLFSVQHSSIRTNKYRNRAQKKKRKTRFCPWAAYLRRKKGMGGELAESWAEIDRKEKEEGGEWWHAAAEDQAESDAEWDQ